MTTKQHNSSYDSVMALASSFLSYVHSLHVPEAKDSPIPLLNLSSQGIQAQLVYFRQQLDQQGILAASQSLVDSVMGTVTLRCCWAVKDHGRTAEECFGWITDVRNLGEELCDKSSKIQSPPPPPAFPPSSTASSTLSAIPTLASNASTASNVLNASNTLNLGPRGRNTS
jgi:hypothetical protein